MRTVGVLAVIVVTSLVNGCLFLEVREQQRRIDALAWIDGTVRTEPPAPATLVVFLVRQDEDDVRLSDHFVLDQAGRFTFMVEPGRYAIGAFEDANRNFVYEPGEPLLPADESGWLELGSGARLEDVALVVPRQGSARLESAVDLRQLTARMHEEQLQVSLAQLTVMGEIAAPEDPSFAPEHGQEGLRRPLDFVLDRRAGVYFMEAFDPKKLPVLFVHGIGGTPRDFTTLADALDRTRQQAWFYFYPTGAPLERLGGMLLGTLRTLRLALGFEDVALVCHSMGGLVCRSLLLAEQAHRVPELVRVLVTIGTPYGGHSLASVGAKHAPAPVPSWVDLDPESGLLQGLFYAGDGTRRRIPSGVPFHLLFGYRRGSGPGGSSDGVVTLESALRLEAQQEAASVHGFDASHVALLRDPEVARELGSILASVAPP